jgi:hypothetical protein
MEHPDIPGTSLASPAPKPSPRPGSARW